MLESEIPFQAYCSISRCNTTQQFLFDIGMASPAQRDQFGAYTDKAVAMIRSGDLAGAFKVWDEMLVCDITGYFILFLLVIISLLL